MTFAARYAAASTVAGGCAIEAGLIGKLADHECEHGRLPFDRSAQCGCWHDVEGAEVILFPTRPTAPDTRRWIA
jgi:hypothetical protein